MDPQLRPHDTAADWAERTAFAVVRPPGIAGRASVKVQATLEGAAFDSLEVGGRPGWRLWTGTVKDPGGPYVARIWTYQRDDSDGYAEVEVSLHREGKS